eukprot:IDg10839t1
MQRSKEDEEIASKPGEHNYNAPPKIAPEPVLTRSKKKAKAPTEHHEEALPYSHLRAARPSLKGSPKTLFRQSGVDRTKDSSSRKGLSIRTSLNNDEEDPKIVVLINEILQVSREDADGSLKQQLVMTILRSS